ncbi:hypothetical protein GQ457_05G028470 [Hibiscus cannabinus]
MYGVQNPVNDPASGNAAANDGFAARPRPIRDYLAPILDDLNPAILAPKIQAAHFELKPLMFDMLNSIGKFGGAPHEDARQHIHAFLEHNPPKMHTQLRNDIASFRQADDESMFECWDRYKKLLRNCTNHGFHDWTQVMMFYNGVNAPTRMMLDASANGTLLDKSPEEAFDILDRIANNDYQFHASRLRSGRRTHGRLDLDANDSIAAQLLAITNMLKNLQRPSQVKEVPVASSCCALCYGIHHVNECPENHDSANYMWNFNISNENPLGQIAQALHARPQGSLPSDTEVTKAQGKEKCSASTLKEAKFGGETLGEPSHEILYEESRLHDDSPLMESMGKGLMSGPNDERQNIATVKDKPPSIGVDGQRVTINVFNTLKYADDFRECQPLQDVESMMANEEPAEFSCINFSLIEDYLKLEDEDNNEIKVYQREVQQSSIIMARPVREAPKQVDNGLNVDVPPATMPQQLQHPSTNEEAHPTYGAQDKPTTIIVELVKTKRRKRQKCNPHPARESLSQLSFSHVREYSISGHRYAIAFLGTLEDKTKKRQKLKIFCSPHNHHCWSFKLGFLVASREGRQARTRERDSLEPFKQWSWLMGVTTLTLFRDKDRVSTTKKSRT